MKRTIERGNEKDYRRSNEKDYQRGNEKVVEIDPFKIAMNLYRYYSTFFLKINLLISTLMSFTRITNIIYITIGYNSILTSRMKSCIID